MSQGFGDSFVFLSKIVLIETNKFSLSFYYLSPSVKHIVKYTEKNTASHSKANTYVVIDGYPSKVLVVLCVG